MVAAATPTQVKAPRAIFQNSMDRVDFTTDQLKAALDQVIAENKASQDKAAADGAKNGMRLRRTPFTALRESGRLSSDYLLDEAAKIEAKASTLPASERQMVMTLVNAAAEKAMASIQAQTKTPKAPIKKAKRQTKTKKA